MPPDGGGPAGAPGVAWVTAGPGGGGGRRRLDLLEPLTQVVDGLLVAVLHALELLAHLLELLTERFGILSRGDSRREHCRGDDGVNDPTTHGLLRGRE
jgi:hypothetical protein